MSTAYNSLADSFAEYHRDPTNVLLHFITTPLGLIGATSILRNLTGSTSLLVVLFSVYLVGLSATLTIGDFLGTVLLCAMIIFATKTWKLSWGMSFVALAAGYLLQDVAHLATGEKTFQGSYTEDGEIDFTMKWLSSFAQHAYFLLPLCTNAALRLLWPILSPEVTKSLHILNDPLPAWAIKLQQYQTLFLLMSLFSIGSYCLDSKNGFCFFPGAPYFTRILTGTVLGTDDNDSECRRKDLKLIRDWVMKRAPAASQSHHWWFKELPTDVYDSFSRVAGSPQIQRMFASLFHPEHYCVEVVEGMNEIYVTGPDRMDESHNSDQIFYTRHVDGPWGVIPFVSVFRCLVGMDANNQYYTHFPLAHFSCNAKEGDLLAFDFNREVHHISQDHSPQAKASSDSARVTLKLHFIAYPRVLAPLGVLMKHVHVIYNYSFRLLFLRTMHPKSLYDKFLALNVSINTWIADTFETWIGQRNAIYLVFSLAIWYISGDSRVFIALTSFVHHFRSITAFQFPHGIDLGSFDRDYILFRAVAMTELVVLYGKSVATSFSSSDWMSREAMSQFAEAARMNTTSLGLVVAGLLATMFTMAHLTSGKFDLAHTKKAKFSKLHVMLSSEALILIGCYFLKPFQTKYEWLLSVQVLLLFIQFLQPTAFLR